MWIISSVKNNVNVICCYFGNWECNWRGRGVFSDLRGYVENELDSLYFIKNTILPQWFRIMAKWYFVYEWIQSPN